MSSRAVVFSRQVRDFVRADALRVTPSTPLIDVVGRMATGKHSAAAVVDDVGGVAGIITEQDIVRRVALRASADQPCGDVMSAPVETIGIDEYLYYAVARMRRLGHRHMPVVDGSGTLTGMLDLNDAMAHAAERLMDQIDELTHENTIDGLRDTKAVQVRLARELADEGMPVDEIQALLTHVNNDIYRRIVEIALMEMTEAGRGAPPVGFTVIVMGSGGRGENYIHPDQDNGFILEDYPDDDHTAIDGWFIELAERMTTHLDTAGFPFCNGYVMATSPLWRKTLSQWKAQTQMWCERMNPMGLRLCDIFFDYRAVYGDAAPADELRRHVADLVTGNKGFLRALGSNDAAQGAALGWFNRFVTVREPAEHRGAVNLKHHGTMPLVNGIRLMALRAGVTANPTLGRMAALAEQGVLDADLHDSLASAFRLIAGLLLRHQINEFEAGRDVTNFVQPKSLTKREVWLLKGALKSVDSFHQRIRFEFAGEVY